MKETIIVFVTLTLIAIVWQVWYMALSRSGQFLNTKRALVVIATTLAPFFTSLYMGVWWLVLIAAAHLFIFAAIIIFARHYEKPSARKVLNVDAHLIEVNQPDYKFK